MEQRKPFQKVVEYEEHQYCSGISLEHFNEEIQKEYENGYKVSSFGMVYKTEKRFDLMVMTGLWVVYEQINKGSENQ